MQKCVSIVVAYFVACASSAPTPPDGGTNASSDAGALDGGVTNDAGGTSACSLAANTSASGTVTSGCNLLVRDTTSCTADRVDAGLSGYWLKFSCRVVLAPVTVSGVPHVQLTADSRPDYTSYYFGSGNACYDATAPTVPNPNVIAAKSILMSVPVTPNTTSQTMPGGAVGLALNGVSIFDNEAAPGDDIYTETQTFDTCRAHPTPNSTYHYHSEPYAISYDDANFIGVMRDG